MHRDTAQEILSVIPQADLTKTVVHLRHNSALTLDSVLRQEDEYLVVRGREAGTNDEYRLFFVPYTEILFIKIDRIMKTDEVQAMFGSPVVMPEDSEATQTEAKAAAAAESPPPEVQDPSTIAKQNLLARIRAARNLTVPSKS